MKNDEIFIFLACIATVFSADTGEETYSLHLSCTCVAYKFIAAVLLVLHVFLHKKLGIGASAESVLELLDFECSEFLTSFLKDP